MKSESAQKPGRMYVIHMCNSALAHKKRGVAAGFGCFLLGHGSVFGNGSGWTLGSNLDPDPD